MADLSLELVEALWSSKSSLVLMRSKKCGKRSTKKSKRRLQRLGYRHQAHRLELERKEKEERLAEVARQTAVGMHSRDAQAEETESGLRIYWEHKGKGIKPEMGSRVRMNYAGYFTDGRLLDTSILEIAEKYEAVDAQRMVAGQYGPTATEYSPQAGLIPGFREGLLQMSVGDKVTLFIPSHLAWGEQGYGMAWVG